ncbi:Cof-type HAD-IIB family hydrolase [Granulicatella sp. zg-ZJ]|uniref:Cof-type HAD-IIB family hydrolase n=1 Tax=Granulicatella sp. zg-ZJ TaxID=2678504 RepID=UPI0013D09A23|nr:Cof-type HAD-IIB family hydrolase [Granulicatella sp. zg-ZJ]NEW62059.1 Cof-type HAD-IIB family hydrolase [Granulicatella sp. zg-ZJ]
MIKLIVSDMDGTLLDNTLNVTKENKDAILYTTKKGIPFVIATGRHLNEALPALKAADLHCPIISANGAAIYNEHQELIKVNAISPNNVLAVLEIAEKYDTLFIELMMLSGILSDQPKKREMMMKTFISGRLHNGTPEEIELAVKEKLKEFPVSYVSSLQQFIKEEKTDKVLKIFVCNTVQNEQLDAFRQDISQLSDVSITSSHPENIEINSLYAQKGIAVKDMARQMNISLEDVFAIGDNMNDYSMISVVGYGVAMGNAVPNLKKAARYVTDKNFESGVAKAIYHFVNEENLA